MKLGNQRLGEFHNILLNAFTLDELDQMLLFQLGINRQHIALGDDFAAVLYRVVTFFERTEQTTELVRAAIRANSKNATLFAFAQRIGVALVTLVGKDGGGGDLSPTNDQTALQREVRKTNSTLDIARWRQRLLEVEQQVCRVEIKTNLGASYGTGFLVGPDSVMTNYHVMKPVIDTPDLASNVRFRFDYKLLEDGDTINSGSVYRLAKNNDWLIHHSEYSPVDELVDTGAATPELTQLDYALVRLNDKPGNLPVGANAGPGAPPRRWITVTKAEYDFEPDTALYIIQHPQGEPLKMCLDTEAIIGVNANRTRVRYRTNTEKGSSGSPCFNKDWDLVALHHSGDPNFEKLHKPTYNQGIPIEMIYKFLEQNNKTADLGQ